MLRSFDKLAPRLLLKAPVEWWLVSTSANSLFAVQSMGLQGPGAASACSVDDSNLSNCEHLHHASSLVGDRRSHVVAFREVLLLLFKHRVNVGDVCVDLLVGRHIGTSRVFTRHFENH